jgi:glyoxylate reductase
MEKVMPRIFITRRIPESGIDLLRERFGAEAVAVAPQDGIIDRCALLEGVRGADALLAILTDPIDAEVMDAAGPELRVIANYAVGYNNIDVAAATERGIPVTNTPGVLTETTADTAWLLLMAAARRLGEGERYLRAGRWTSWGPTLLLGMDIHNATLGIFGMGRIGRAMARRARGFGMTVIYHDAEALDAETEAELDARSVTKDELLKQSDFLSIHCPLSPATAHAIGAEELQAMKPSAVLINTARGPVLDEAALAHALKAGEIFAAGLDVFEEEPAIHPGLLACENAVLLPHLGSASEKTRSRMADIAARNIIARLEGRKPPECVNPEVL